MPQITTHTELEVYNRASAAAMTIPSQGNNLSFEEATARLATNQVVDGLLTIGSASRREMTPASDYDVIVILRGVPVSLRVALTYIDHRLTDIIFVNVTEIERILQTGSASAHPFWDDAQLLCWLRTGQIIFDRTGQLRSAQNKANAQPEKETSENEVYAAWFGVNYNLKQTRRLLTSTDPAYLMAVDMRLLFSLHDLWRDYFLIRRLPQQGEKAQARYLAISDPMYLETFRQCLAENNRNKKFQLYQKLAELTTAPIGSLWEDEVTSILPEPGIPWDTHTVQTALSFWQSLLQSSAG